MTALGGRGVAHRRRLYQQYVSHHFGTVRDISVEACERQCPVFRGYFGHVLPRNRAAKILDLGCGFGGLLYFLRREGYRNTVGVDISPEQVETARRLDVGTVHLEDVRTFVERHAADFDCITALDLVEHLPKPDVPALLDAIHRALRPGGVFVMQAPNGASPFGGAVRWGDFGHEFALTRESASQLLMMSGFEDISVSETAPVAHGVVSAARRLLWSGLRSLLAAYLLVETGSFRGHVLTQNLIAVGRKRAP
jgi:2-polyprenyl-3-methyl-5-hydroxy-6-metoxy-1,4-benzoquinol methylase